MFNLRRLYFDFTFYLLPSSGISSSFMPVYLLLVGIVVVEVKLAFFAVSEYDHFSCSCSLPSHLPSEFVLGATLPSSYFQHGIKDVGDIAFYGLQTFTYPHLFS
jgi:hypothetical protein